MNEREKVTNQFNTLRGVFLLRRFSLEQVATCMNIPVDTVRGQVDELHQKGLVFAPEGTPNLYCVSPETARRAELKELIQEIRRLKFPNMPTQRVPESPYYRNAVKVLDQIDRGRPKSPATLGQVQRTLEFARRYEAMLDDGVAEASAALDVAQARLAVLQGNEELAIQLLLNSHNAFTQARLEVEAKQVETVAKRLNLDLKS